MATTVPDVAQLEWHLLARQTGVPPEVTSTPNGGAWAALNPTDPSAENFGVLQPATVERYRMPSGFVFKYHWPKGLSSCGASCGVCDNGASCSMVWAQTSNPAQETAVSGLKMLADISGPSDMGGAAFAGLVKCNGPAIVCNALPWWYCIGCHEVCGAPTFPGGATPPAASHPS